MKTKTHFHTTSIVLMLTALILATQTAQADGNITTTSGDLYLRPAGGDVIVEGNIKSSSLQSDGNLSIKPSGSSNTYYQYYVDDSGYAHIHLVPNSLSVDRQIFSHSLSRSQIIHEFYMGAGRATLTVRSDDNKDLILGKLNATDSTYPGWGYFGAETPLALMVSSDWDDFLVLQTKNNIPYIGAYGGNTIYFHDGTQWETIHADAFTAHSTWYNGDTMDARHDLSEWTNRQHPLGLSDEDASNKTAKTFGETGTDLSLAGQATAKVLLELDNTVTGGQCYNPAVNGSLLERIDTLEKKVAELEAALNQPHND